MCASHTIYTYGPVPSRRLGRSLGVDLVPFKTCTYDCTYCQLGTTTLKTLEREEYAPRHAILAALDDALTRSPSPDYITLAGSGEPTLHSGIGTLIKEIKRRTDVPVAVLTNGSLLWMPSVRDELSSADLVLPSLDAGDDAMFRRVNRPHPSLEFDVMVDGLAEFTHGFHGEVWLEVLLLEGLTSTPTEVSKIAAHVERIRPSRVQLNTAWRPTAQSDARAVPVEDLEVLAALFPGEVDVVAERNDTTIDAQHATAPADDEIVGLLKRRPCTVADVARALGLHRTEAQKRLDALRTRRLVRTEARERNLFYLPLDRS